MFIRKAPELKFRNTSNSKQNMSQKQVREKLDITTENQ